MSLKKRGFPTRGRNKKESFNPYHQDNSEEFVLGEVDDDDIDTKRAALEDETVVQNPSKKSKAVVQQSNVTDQELLSQLAATLVQAARTGNFEQLKKTIEQGANVNEKVCGCTAIMYASFHGRLDMVQYLIDNGADVNVSNLSGFTSLAWATERNHRAIVELLLKHGAQANQADNCGLTPLHKAARSGYIEICKLLVEVGGANLALTSKKENSGVSVLQEACSSGHMEAVLFLLDADADVDQQDSQGRTALIRAVLKNHAAIAEVLIKFGAIVNLADNTGRTPLHWAAFNGNLTIVQLLISKKADLSIVDKTNQTAQQIASVKKHTEVESFFENILQLTANALNTDNNIQDNDAVDEMFQ